jgi:DNA mismatch repair protein MutL
VLHQVPSSNLKQRLVALLGNAYNQRLIPVSSETGIVNIHGFIGKPEFAKKTRGEQYFFTNGRFIKNPYLHHAIENAFQQLITKDSFPTYFIYLTVDPKTLDVNIHPTKTEVNFQDIKSIYAILHSSVRQSIGKFNLTPSLDFETEPSMDIPPLPKGEQVKQPTITIDPHYNPFEKKVKPQFEIPMPPRGKGSEDQWIPLYDPLKDVHFKPEMPGHDGDANQHLIDWGKDAFRKHAVHPFQVENRFIVGSTPSGIVIVDPQKARERIFYERMMDSLENNQPSMQHQLHPQTILLSPEDFEMTLGMIDVFGKAGFSIREFGKNTFLIEAVPAGCAEENINDLFENLLEGLKSDTDDGKTRLQVRMARSMAKNMAITRKPTMQIEEMEGIIEQLLACKVPDLTPDGNPTMMVIIMEDLHKKFK